MKKQCFNDHLSVLKDKNYRSILVLNNGPTDLVPSAVYVLCRPRAVTWFVCMDVHTHYSPLSLFFLFDMVIGRFGFFNSELDIHYI